MTILIQKRNTTLLCGLRYFFGTAKRKLTTATQFTPTHPPHTLPPTRMHAGAQIINKQLLIISCILPSRTELQSSARVSAKIRKEHAFMGVPALPLPLKVRACAVSPKKNNSTSVNQINAVTLGSSVRPYRTIPCYASSSSPCSLLVLFLFP